MSQHKLSGPGSHHKSNGGRRACTICGKMFAPYEENVYEYQGVKLCYIHIVQLTRQDNTLFRKLSCQMNGFNLETFIEETNKTINCSTDGQKIENTIKILSNFIKRSRLNIEWLGL